MNEGKISIKEAGLRKAQLCEYFSDLLLDKELSKEILESHIKIETEIFNNEPIMHISSDNSKFKKNIQKIIKKHISQQNMEIIRKYIFRKIDIRVSEFMRLLTDRELKKNKDIKMICQKMICQKNSNGEENYGYDYYGYEELEFSVVK